LMGMVSASCCWLAGCAGADFDPTLEPELESVEPEIGTLEQPLCENRGGTNAVMTAIAVAAGREMGRWLPERDFQWNNSTGMLELSQHAYPRCADRQCKNTRALLRSLLKSNWSAQMSCNSSGQCGAPDHDLRFLYSEPGSCDRKFFFNPLRMGTNTRLSFADTDRLKNKLKFVGYPGNKMLNFYIRNGEVSVDPTYGLNEGASASVGSCDAACTKFTSSDVTGRCCSCNGATRRYARSTFNASVYLCK
jgi:hypothetical protein